MLTYEEWLDKCGSKLRDDEFMSANELRTDFLVLHGINIDDEIDKINREEYELYKQRDKAEQELKAN
jgi:hypothetical protein